MKIPDKEHWAIITVNQIYVPGDERSKTNPGHGYPEHYEETIGYQAFTDYEDFHFEVSRMHHWGKKFRVVHVKPLKVEIETTVTIK